MARYEIPHDIDAYPNVAKLCRMGCTLSQGSCVGTDGKAYQNLRMLFPLDIYDFYATDLSRIETLAELEQWCEQNKKTLDARIERALKIRLEKARLKVRFLPKQHVYRLLGSRDN